MSQDTRKPVEPDPAVVDRVRRESEQQGKPVTLSDPAGVAAVVAALRAS